MGNILYEKKEISNNMSILCINNGYFVLARDMIDAIQYMKTNYDYLKINNIYEMDMKDYVKIPFDLEKESSKLANFLEEKEEKDYSINYDCNCQLHKIEMTLEDAIRFKNIKNTDLLCFSEENEVEYEN